MPSNLVKNIAKKKNISIGTVEKEWKHIKNSIDNSKIKKGSNNYYDTIVSILKKHYKIK